MNEYKLIINCRIRLIAAESSMIHDDHESYCRAMASILDLLVEELVGDAPGTPEKPLAERSKS